MPSASTGLLAADSNVLVYAVDEEEQQKSIRANDLLDRIAAAERGFLTSQMLTEFYAATVRSRPNRRRILDPATAVSWVEHWIAIFPFRPISAAIAEEATHAAQRHQMHIYDALMWSTAKFAEATILTEDIQSQPFIDGVQYINPFADDFAFEDIGL